MRVTHEAVVGPRMVIRDNQNYIRLIRGLPTGMDQQQSDSKQQKKGETHESNVPSAREAGKFRLCGAPVQMGLRGKRKK
jgi:hypothetical protein